VNQIEYKYKTANEIFSNIYFVKDFSIIDIIILILLLICLILTIYYILPIIYILKEKLRADRKKRERKNLLKKIMLQKEIGDEIFKVVEKKEKK
jgi:uncharacterized membrane protein